MFLRKPEGLRAKGWFWTPYPESEDLKGGDRWIPVSRNPAVPAGLGRWGGYPPAKVNIDMITYLATTPTEPPELEPGLRHVSVVMTAEMLSAGKFVKRFGDVEMTFLCPRPHTTKVGVRILYSVPDVDENI